MRGKYFRYDAKPTTGSYHQVDIRWINRQTKLKPGGRHALHWSIDGKPTGSIGYNIEGPEDGQATALRLVYSVNGEPTQERVPLDWTACNYGGARPWVLCPRCSRRVAILYGGRRFLCRHCHGLTYASTRQDASDRAIEKARKIQKRLGGDGNMTRPLPWQKPKGMHWDTFNRLRHEYHEQHLQGLMAAMERLGITL